MEKMY